MAFEFCKPEHRGGRAPSFCDGIRLTVINEVKDKPQLKIRISGAILSKLRWLKGDMVFIGFDMENRLIKVQRSTKEGWKLTTGGKHSSDVALYFKAGFTFFRADVRTILLSILSQPYDTNDVIYESDGLVFNFPTGIKNNDTNTITTP